MSELVANLSRPVDDERQVGRAVRFEDDDWGALVTGASRPRVGEVLLAPAAHVARVGDRRRDRCRRRPVGRRRPPCTLRGFQGLSWVLAGPLEGDDGALEVAGGGGQGTARSRRLGVDDRGAILYRSRIGGLSFLFNTRLIPQPGRSRHRPSTTLGTASTGATGPVT